MDNYKSFNFKLARDKANIIEELKLGSGATIMEIFEYLIERVDLKKDAVINILKTRIDEKRMEELKKWQKNKG